MERTEPLTWCGGWCVYCGCCCFSVAALLGAALRCSQFRDAGLVLWTASLLKFSFCNSMYPRGSARSASVRVWPAVPQLVHVPFCGCQSTWQVALVLTRIAQRLFHVPSLSSAGLRPFRRRCSSRRFFCYRLRLYVVCVAHWNKRHDAHNLRGNCHA